MHTTCACNTYMTTIIVILAPRQQDMAWNNSHRLYIYTSSSVLVASRMLRYSSLLIVFCLCSGTGSTPNCCCCNCGNNSNDDDEGRDRSNIFIHYFWLEPNVKYYVDPIFCHYYVHYYAKTIPTP